MSFIDVVLFCFGFQWLNLQFSFLIFDDVVGLENRCLVVFQGNIYRLKLK